MPKTTPVFKRSYFTFNGKNSKDFMLFLSGPAVYNSAAPDVESITIPGRNGELIQNNAATSRRRFANVDISYDAFFFNGLPAQTAAVKAWLLSPNSYCELRDTYDPDFYRMAVCTSAIEFDVTRQKAAEMTLTFNCKPQRWSIAGSQPITFTASGTVLNNRYEFYAEPLITVTGTGAGILKIGDYSVALYYFDDGDITLDSETQNAYLADGSFCNDSIYTDEFPLLAPGNNTVSWTGGIETVSITPRWWTL